MFYPNLPQENTPADAVQMRSQLNGLKALIDAIQTVTAVQVDSTNTLPPGSPANASVSVVGNTLHFSFDLPQGNDGAAGSDGGPGADGPQGPPFAQAVVDGVNTLDPWENATVDASFDGSDVHFTFGIPRGNDGSSGSDGANGSDGAPGEVSQQQLDDAINGTSANTNSISTLDNSYADPDVEELRQKLNELILNGRR